MLVRKRAGSPGAARRRCAGARALRTLERLEDRLLMSSSPAAVAEDDWRQETISIGDADQQVYADSASSANSLAYSALPLIGGVQEQQQYGFTGTGYSVAIIDTGLDYTNPAFAGRYLGGWNFVGNNDNPMDDNGHGTHVAGIIASADPDHPGVAPGAGIIALKVLNSSGTGSFGNVDLALKWVASHQQQDHIAAVNMSLGTGNFASSEPWTMLDSDLETLRQEGVFVAASSGNSYYSYGSQQGLAFPAINNLVVSVGAVWNAQYSTVTWADGATDYTTAPDQITSFTQRSSQLDILAPGAFITSTYLNDTFATMAGTSMAAPVVTGAAVDILQALDAEHLSATPQQMLSIMQGTGVSIVDANHGQDNVKHTGQVYKRLDLLNAIQSIVGSTPAPPPSTPAPPAQPAQSSAMLTFVDAIYHQVLGRAADPAGLSAWAARLASGLDRYDFVRLLWDSVEHRAQQVADDYEQYLHRSASAGDIRYWVGVFQAGASETTVADAFLHAPEFLDAQSDNAAFVQTVFHDLLGRAADPESLNSLTTALAAGVTRSQLVDLVLHCPERTAYVIGQYYQQYLGRSDSPAEEQNWAQLLASGLVDLESVAEIFLSSSEYFNGAAAHDHAAALARLDALTAVIAGEVDEAPTTSDAPFAWLGQDATADSAAPHVDTAANDSSARETERSFR